MQPVGKFYAPWMVMTSSTLSCLKEVDPAKQVSTWVVINKTALDMTAPGEKPLASKDTWDCYLNFPDETSKFYIPPALLYSTTPSEYHSNAIYQAMGIPSSWLQGGTQHLLQSALFMKPDEFPQAPWVLLPNSAKQSVLKGYNEGMPPVERRDEPPLRNDQPLRDDCNGRKLPGPMPGFQAGSCRVLK
eukprot:jgi/Botrbrau1/10409/Bobra.0133s0018.1